MLKKIHLLSLILGGFFLCLDQIIKHFFLAHTSFSFYIIKPWLGLEYFENPGIAFGIPLPNAVVLILTPLVIFLLLILFFKPTTKSLHSWAFSCIIAGAISNFVDRIFFDFTVDYIRIFTSILNIGDILIVVGALLLLSSELKKKESSISHT